jgi:hypothetical protein
MTAYFGDNGGNQLGMARRRHKEILPTISAEKIVTPIADGSAAPISTERKSGVE